MSQYLIDQIQEVPNIQLWTHASVAEAHGGTHLEEISVLCSDTNKVERVPASAMFIFIGALPRTDWLANIVERDERGFILTGPDLIRDGQRPKGWALDRDPFLLETNVSRHFCRRRCTPRFYQTSGFRSWRRIRGGTVHPSVFEQGINGRQIGITSRPSLRRSARRSDCVVPTQAQETHIKAGDTYVRQGDPADWMFVILEGQFQWRGEFGGETIVLSAKPGDVTGVLPFSRMKEFTVTGRAVTDGRVLRFPVSRFSELVQKMPELTTRLVGLMSDRIRETTRIEQQRDPSASLGKLSAGLAHELNNPASAAKRATSQLRTILRRIKDASHELGRRELMQTTGALYCWGSSTKCNTRRVTTRPWRPASSTRAGYVETARSAASAAAIREMR